jgi:hypothetical protein
MGILPLQCAAKYGGSPIVRRSICMAPQRSLSCASMLDYRDWPQRLISIFSPKRQRLSAQCLLVGTPSARLGSSKAACPSCNAKNGCRGHTHSKVFKPNGLPQVSPGQANERRPGSGTRNQWKSRALHGRSKRAATTTNSAHLRHDCPECLHIAAPPKPDGKTNKSKD